MLIVVANKQKSLLEENFEMFEEKKRIFSYDLQTHFFSSVCIQVYEKIKCVKFELIISQKF